jgi:hypothetical protein
VADWRWLALLGVLDDSLGLLQGLGAGLVMVGVRLVASTQ